MRGLFLDFILVRSWIKTGFLQKPKTGSFVAQKWYKNHSFYWFIFGTRLGIKMSINEPFCVDKRGPVMYNKVNDRGKEFAVIHNLQKG